MIECHIRNCENHIGHTFGEDEGPFCALSECVKSNDEMIEMLQAQRKIPVYNFVPEEEKAVMREFMTVCAAVFSFIGAVALLSWGLA
jgi:peptide methionine sulfoxide reductase MsrB